MAVDYNPREHHRGTGSAAANLGAVYGELGETQKAIERFNLGLEYWQKTGEPFGEGRVRYLLGEFYLSLGDLAAAADNLRQALDKWRISGDPNGIANVLQGLGNVSLRTGAYAVAARYLDEALAMRVKHKQPRGQAEAFALLGRLHTATGEMAKALDYYHQALTLWREVGGRDGEASVLTYLGEAHAKLGDQQRAETSLQESFRLHRLIGSPAGEAQALYLLARVRRDLGRADTARADIEAAIEIAESLRASVVSADLRASYLASVRDYYEFYIDLLMRERGQQSATSVRAALHVNERASARSLLESLRESRADIRQGVDAALLASERELQQLLNGKSAYQVRLLSGKHTPAQAAAAAASINEIVGRLRDTHAHIKSVSPRYAALTQPQPLTAEQIQRELLDEETLLLEYSLGEERSFLWAVTPATLTSYELPGRAEIEAQAVRVYDLLTARNRRARGETPQQYKQRAARADAELTPQAAALSRLLLGPVAHQLGRKRLLVVAPGKLQFVPFGALPEPDGATGKRKDAGRASRMKPRHNPPSFVPLIVNHEIVSLPSASTLAALRRETLGRRPAPKAIALLADPVFEADDDRLNPARVSSTQKTGAPEPSRLRRYADDLLRARAAFSDADEPIHFRRLEATGWEARQIARLAPSAQVLKAEGFAANRATATGGELSRYRIVHFASHSYLHSAHPELSGIVLSLLDERGREQDGFLRLHEIYNLKLASDLVVLSACQTGLGKEIRGEGLMSLTRGFMYAGAPRVIVSAWSVEDRASATLMVKFYKHLLGKQPFSPAAALRAAQLEMWRDHEFTAPYFWAGFVLQGEWQ